MLYYTDKNWYHFTNKYLEQFLKFAFQEVTRPAGWPNRHILEILLTHRHALAAQNCRASVRLHHWYTVCCVLYIQACSFNRKILEQICTLSTVCMFN